MAVALQVSGLSGELCRVEAQWDWSVRQLKECLKIKLGIPVCEQRLLLGIRHMQDDASLLREQSCTQGDSAEIVLLRRGALQSKYLEELHRAEDACTAYEALVNAPEEVKADKDVVLAAIPKHPMIYCDCVSQDLQRDPEVILCAIVHENSMLEEGLPQDLSSDKEFMHAAVKALPCSSTNRSLMAASASVELKADRDFIMTYVQKYGSALEIAARSLKSDREVVMAAVQNDAGALQWAADDLKADRGVVLAAVAQDGYALRHAAEVMKADREVVLTAAKCSNFNVHCETDVDQCIKKQTCGLGAAWYAHSDLWKDFIFVRNIAEICGEEAVQQAISRVGIPGAGASVCAALRGGKCRLRSPTPEGSEARHGTRARTE